MTSDDLVERLRRCVANRELPAWNEIHDAADEIERLRQLAALPDSKRASEDGWRPIETAPKDKCIMLCVEGFQPSAGRWWPIDSCWMSFDWEGHFESDKETSEYVNGTRYEPTHWRPLPAPPAPSREPRPAGGGEDGQGK